MGELNGRTKKERQRTKNGGVEMTNNKKERDPLSKNWALIVAITLSTWNMLHIATNHVDIYLFWATIAINVLLMSYLTIPFVKEYYSPIIKNDKDSLLENWGLHMGTILNIGVMIYLWQSQIDIYLLWKTIAINALLAYHLLIPFWDNVKNNYPF